MKKLVPISVSLFKTNRFPAWKADTTTLFDVTAARLHRLAESIPELLNRLQIRALFFSNLARHKTPGTFLRSEKV